MSSKLISCIRHDLQEGIKKNCKIYLAFMIYLLVENMNYTRQLAVLRRNTPELELLGVMDYIIHYFQGSLPYSLMKHTEAFKIPVEWFCIMIFFSLMIFRYPKEDYKNCGYQYITRSGNKIFWWLSKCIWCVCCVLLGIAGMWAVSGVTALCFGEMRLTPGSILNRKANDIIFADSIGWKKITAYCIMAIIVLLFFALLQLVVTFLINDIGALIVNISIIAASAYYLSPLLPGNYLMLKRCTCIYGNGGVSMGQGIMIYSAGCLVLAVIGYICFRQKDIF